MADDPTDEDDARLPATPNEHGAVRCPHCNISFKLTDTARWTGWRHRTCGGAIDIGQAFDDEFVWGVVANISEKVGVDGSPFAGTKEFSPKSKVYVLPTRQRDLDRVEVLGRHRTSARWVKMFVRTRQLRAFRPKKLYKPTLVRLYVKSFDHTDGSEAAARRFAQSLSYLNMEDADG